MRLSVCLSSPSFLDPSLQTHTTIITNKKVLRNRANPRKSAWQNLTRKPEIKFLLYATHGFKAMKKILSK